MADKVLNLIIPDNIDALSVVCIGRGKIHSIGFNIKNNTTVLDVSAEIERISKRDKFYRNAQELI